MASKGSKYRLGERIGGGGMAEVYRATLVGAEGFARQVAIKRMLPTLSADPTFAEMFVNEARLASVLGHPNIVATLDFDRDDEQRLFLVMELVDGCDLRQLLATGRPPVGVSAFIAAEVLRALGYAHDLQQNGRPLTIVHRDVSPHNVLLSWGGAVKLTDFGIAKAIAASSASRTGSLKGKVGYMSPEQAHGLAIDGRSDLFAVGVMFHELLTGQRLFAGATEAEVLSRMLAQPISSPRERFDDISEDVDFVCMRLLARDRDQRFASAQAALEALLGSQAMSVRAELELKQLLRERFPEQSTATTGSLGVAQAGASGTRPQGRQARQRADLMDAETRTRSPETGTAAAAVTASATPTAAGEQVAAPLSGSLPDRREPSARTAARGRRSRLFGLITAGAVVLAIGYFAFFTGRSNVPSDTGVTEGATGGPPVPAPARAAGSPPGVPAGEAPASSAATAAGETVNVGAAVGDAGPPGSGRDAAAAAGDIVEAPTDKTTSVAAPAADTVAPDAEATSSSSRRRRRARRQREAKAERDKARAEAAARAGAETAASEDGESRSRSERKAPGRLRITVRPWALVSIDGGDERQTPLPTVTLPPGRHRIRLRNDELDKREVRTVTVRSGKTHVIDLDWRR